MGDERHIGHYRVIEELGRGGMGVVYKAYDDTLNRHVAIKVLSEQLATHDEVVERFKREAKSMGALNDPHIIQIYFIGEDKGQPFFAMEFVEGQSLSQRLKGEGKLSVGEARRILKETASGLATAHDRGVIHRDIKPGNLMLDTRGRVKIADFGIAMTHELGDRLTRTGEFVGTPGYLSPEVCTGKQVDQRSDIFALGIVFYEMLTGDLPFTESSPLGMMLEVVKAEIPDIREINNEVDDNTYRILTRMIAKDPDERYQNCHDLMADLSRTPSTQPGIGPADQPATVVSGVGATVAMPTPPPGAGPQPASPPSSRSLTASSSKELAVTDAKRSRAPWVAAAALLAVALGAGGTWAFRNQLFGEGGTGQTPRLASGAVLTERADEPAGTSAEPSDAELEAALRQTLQPEGAEAAAGSGGSGGDEGAMADAGSGGDQGAMADAGVSEQPESGPFDDVEPTRLEGQTLAVTESQPATVVQEVPPQQQATSQTAADQPTAASAAGRQQDEPQQLAKLTPPPKPAKPRIVVMAVGDPAIARPVEQMLENRLMGEDLDLLDESFISGLGRAVGPDRIDLGEASRIILDEGGTILLLAQVDYIGETELQYYGQYSTLYSVNLNVRGYDLAGRRALGPGVTEKIDFTNLNADQKAKEALSPHLARIADSLKAETR